MAFKQWKVSDLIRELQKAQRRYGDLPMLASRDEEGNGFNPLGQCSANVEDGYCSIGVDDALKPTKIILWPFDA
jgi:hypothetical protein